MNTLKNLPPALVAGWIIWLAGGLILMIWFRRRSAPRRPAPSDVSAEQSRNHAASHGQTDVRVPQADPP